jgi:hypothetical protein
MSGSIVPPIPKLKTRWGEWSTSIPGRFIPHPLQKKKNRGGENPRGFGEEKNLLPLSLNIEEYLRTNERPYIQRFRK